MARRAGVQHEQLEPAGRADVDVRRRRDGARRGARAAEGREDGALAHAVAVRRAGRGHERELGVARIVARQADRDGDLLAVRPVRVGQAQRGRRGAVEQVRRHEDLDAVLLRVHAVLGVRAGDDDAPVLEERRFRVVQAGHDRRGHDAHAAAERLARVVQDGAEVGRRRQPKAGDALVRAVDNQVRAVGQGADARHDALRRHAFDGPCRAARVGLGGDAVVVGFAAARRRAAADEDLEIVRVGRGLWEQHHSSLERIRAAGLEIVDVARHVGQDLDRVERHGVQDAGLVVVGHEDAARRDHREEGIQVERVRPVQPVAEDEAAAGRWEELERGRRRAVGAHFTAHHQDGSVGHDHGGGIPARRLEMQLVVVLLPVVDAGHARRAIRPVQADTEHRLLSPAANVDLAAHLVGEGQ